MGKGGIRRSVRSSNRRAEQVKEDVNPVPSLLRSPTRMLCVDSHAPA